MVQQGLAADVLEHVQSGRGAGWALDAGGQQQTSWRLQPESLDTSQGIAACDLQKWLQANRFEIKDFIIVLYLDRVQMGDGRA